MLSQHLITNGNEMNNLTSYSYCVWTTPNMFKCCSESFFTQIIYIIFHQPQRTGWNLTYVRTNCFWWLWHLWDTMSSFLCGYTPRSKWYLACVYALQGGVRGASSRNRLCCQPEAVVSCSWTGFSQRSVSLICLLQNDSVLLQRGETSS